jgi:hypothetical protein
MTTPPNQIEALLAGVVRDGLVATDSGDGQGIVMVPQADLEMTTGMAEDANEVTAWVEFRRPGTDKAIHRSVHVHLKQGNAAFGVASDVGG